MIGKKIARFGNIDTEQSNMHPPPSHTSFLYKRSKAITALIFFLIFDKTSDIYNTLKYFK